VSKGVYVALSGARAQEQALEATATNVANATSAGYQRMRPVFRQVLSRAVKGDEELRYATTARTALDTTPGAIRVTQNPLDVALPKGAYLAVTTPRGERYTRAGNLGIDAEGVLKTASGVPLASDADKPITANRNGGPVSIDADGTVKQAGAAIGKLKVVEVETPDALSPEGGGLLGIGGAGAVRASTKELTVGAVEESNAQPVTAMSEMMQASRTFEAFQKVLDQFGEIDRKLLTTVPTAVE